MYITLTTLKLNDPSEHHKERHLDVSNKPPRRSTRCHPGSILAQEIKSESE